MEPSPDPIRGDAAAPSRLDRRLSLFDAVVIGLGAMLGAGVFAAIGAAARAAGTGLLIGLGIATVVAYCNATSSAQLAALYPQSGDTYVYGRERLGPFWGYLAGWGFVVGKTASCAAMALTVGAYAWPDWQRPIAVGAVVALTAVNYQGVRKTAVRTGDLNALSPVVRVGGTVAALGVLLSLIVGVSRTTFAMAANGEMPRWLDAFHPRHRVPHRAELAVGAVVTAVVLVADVRGAIGFSSFAVLTYYAIANASAYTLPPHRRHWPRGLAVLGVAGCVVLALTLPAASVIGGLIVLALGALVWLVKLRRRHA